MRAYNFSRLDTREKRFYSIADINVSSSGIPTKLIIIAFVLCSISAAINIPLSGYIGTTYWAPLTADGQINTWGILLVWGIPIGIAAGLYYIKIQNYRLFDFLVIYFKPKHDMLISGKRAEHTKIKFDAFLEKQGRRRK